MQSTRLGPLPGVLAVVAIAALAGIAIRVGGRADDRETPRAAPAVSQTVTQGALRVAVPPGWARTERVPRVPGMSRSRPVVLVNGRSKVEVVVTTLPATSQTLLPAPFVRGMAGDLPRPSTSLSAVSSRPTTTPGLSTRVSRGCLTSMSLRAPPEP